ncbi:IS256 family transposase [Persicobacter diffluens]|uniref:Mutator family transposase n=1 Tax=Persicobacter diffluens TaxID=981 RepID=A0AAN4W394_9BACT|nr:IS256 family transposase [Persicobacter diffluens]GJM63452.1 IS256 family transposase [Persicobacter diffluens]GJM64866.1 IS256 family transposase [Persicobacter diffluens]GJM65081.1 IS256 family transposase [Persicobacter diffluens]
MSEINQIPPIAEATHDLLTETIRAGAKEIIRLAVEAELEEYLKQFRDLKTADGKAAVVRNGHLPEREVQTGIGPVTVRVPKIRSKTGAPVSFQSVLVPPYVRKSKSLEAAIPWLYLKGISTGEMNDALEALLGPGASGLSSSTISRLKTEWGKEYDVWRKASLADKKWAYIWVDGIYSGLRKEDDKLCALVVIGVDSQGRKHFLAIEDGVRESKQSWKEVLLELKHRGMNAPKLAIGDGALGFWAALEEEFPKTKAQRCWMHKTGNVLNCLPKSAQQKAKDKIHQIWMAETKEEADKAFDLFIDTYEAKYPKAAICLQKDRDELLNFYDFPAEHWQSIRTTNPIESSFGTIRHRTKRSKGCLDRDGMLHMIFKLGMCAEKNWNRIRGYKTIEKVIREVKFKDGEEIKQAA